MKNRNSTSATRWLYLVAAIGLALGTGCAASPVCRSGVADNVTVAGRTAGEAVKGGAETGVEGVKSMGRAVKGTVEGGTRGTEEEWNAGKRDTTAAANRTAAQTRAEAATPVCP